MSISASTASLIFNKKDFIKSNDDTMSAQSAVINLISGAFDARIIVMVHSHEDLLKSDDPQLLHNLFKALKVKMDDVCIMELDNSPIRSWKNLSKEVEAEYVILFGIKPKDIGLQILAFKNKWLPFNNRHFIFTDDIKIMTADKDSKVPFWSSLKPIFLAS